MTVRNKFLNDNTMIFIMFFIAMSLKFLLYGFRYFPLLDDYIQYGSYSLFKDNAYVLFDIGTIKTRPLASILDLVFWSKIWTLPFAALSIITILQLFSGLFFINILKKFGIKASPVFLIMYLLFPAGSEGSFWLSASSRIVVGIFFSSFALYELCRFMEDPTPARFSAFFFLLIISCGFYEAVAVFGFAAGMIIILFSHGDKKALPVLALLFALTISFLYPILAKDIGKMGSRAASFSIINTFLGIGELAHQFIIIMKEFFYDILINGFASGVMLLFGKGLLGIFYLLIVFTVSLFIGIYSARLPKDSLSSGKNTIVLFAGILFVIVPLLPNLASSPVWLTYRSIFLSLAGIGLIFDRLLALVKKDNFRFVFIAALCFICIISSVNEYDTFKRVSETDKAMLTHLSGSLGSEVKAGKKSAVVLLDSEPVTNQICYSKDHVKSVFCADWSLTGAIRYFSKNIHISSVTPVFCDSVSEDEIISENTQIIDMQQKK